jgi:hypothetical protein
MKKVLLLSSLYALGAIASYGATSCVANGTLASYITLGTTGCEIGDKVFSNFAYTGATGTDPTSSQILVGNDFLQGIMEFGLQFQSSGTTWTVPGFAISYTIAVDQTACQTLYSSGACSMFAAQGSFQGQLAPNAAALTMVLTPGTTINLDDLSTGDNTQQKFFTNTTSTNVVITGTGASNSAPINSIGLDVYQTAVPEPVSMSLTGLGLLGLGFFGRRRLKQ